MSIQGPPSDSSPVVNLSPSDPRCNNDSCRAFYEAHLASQEDVSYTLQFEYGHWTTWYYLGIIGIFACLHLSRLWRARHLARCSDEGTKPTALDKARAARRALTYRRLRGSYFDRLGLPSCGMGAFLFITFALFVVATFAVQPYYRENRGYGSPPICIRTGMMAVACTPIIVALSGKANIITLLTGIGHEKLNVIHRQVARMCFFLSLVHAIPYVMFPLKEGGIAALTAEFYKPGAFEYTGTFPLAVLFGIVLLSVPWIRRCAYETFWHVHILLGLTYLGLMFWHTSDQQDSWAYLWATLALLFASVVTRVFYFNRAFHVHGKWFRGTSASLQKLAGGMTRVSLIAPPGFSWRPGQHCYIRLPSLRPWDNHPFTIAVARCPLKSEKDDDSSDLLFLARTRAGFTQALHQVAGSTPDATAEVWLDGPYGGIRQCIGHTYQQYILIAGGVGVSACLPWLQSLVDSMADGDQSCAQNATLLWIVRHTDHVSWILPELQELLKKANPDRVGVRIYVTREEEQEDWLRKSDESSQRSKADDISSSGRSIPDYEHELDITYCRPFIGDLLPAFLTSEQTLVIACGPESLKIDASNACANEQRRILRGSRRELKFYSESFGW